MCSVKEYVERPGVIRRGAFCRYSPFQESFSCSMILNDSIRYSSSSGLL